MKMVKNHFVICLIGIIGNFTIFGQFTEDSNNSPGTPSAASATNLSVQKQDERYRIGFQDTLEVQVFKHPELTQKINVNPDGTIILARAERPIIAVCKTERELADEITKEYTSFLRNPYVNVMVTEQKSQSFGVIGAVEKPGNFYVSRRVRLLELLAFAGGPSKEAGYRLIVARTGSSNNCQGNETKETGDLILMDFKIRDVLEAKESLWMEPGDIVSVLDTDVVFVYGNVNRQGQVRMKEPITLTQALASAEGLKPATKKDKIRILRQTEGKSDREELVFNLKDIDEQKISDPYLEPNDVVAVSEDSAKSIMRSIGRSLTNGIPGLFYRIP